MENNILLYLKEIDKQIDFSFMAIDDIKNYSSDDKRVWYSIQSFLVSTSNISKILFGTKYADKKRTKSLRKILNISVNSKLKDRKTRNRFEHFDEKLDKFFKSNNANDNFIDSNLGDINGIKIEGVNTQQYMRHYDNNKHIIYFMDQELKVDDILGELKELQKTIRELT